jgi:protein-tyrosine-phosphatase
VKRLIVFVCNGNIYRSVVAAQCLRNIFKNQEVDSKFEVDSYGLQGTKGTKPPERKRLSDYPKEWRVAKPILRQFDIDISKHRFQKISAGVMRKASVVIAMDDKVYSGARNSLVEQFPMYARKIHRFSELTANHGGIKDPAGSGCARLHKRTIKSIYFTLNKKYRDILVWTK